MAIKNFFQNLVQTILWALLFIGLCYFLAPNTTRTVLEKAGTFLSGLAGKGDQIVGH